MFKRVWKSTNYWGVTFFCINASFSGPSHDEQKSSVIAVLLHCIEEEMHFSVRCGAFQASCNSDSVNHKDYFVLQIWLYTYHRPILLSASPVPPLPSSSPLCFMFFLDYDSVTTGIVESYCFILVSRMLDSLSTSELHVFAHQLKLFGWIVRCMLFNMDIVSYS